LESQSLALPRGPVQRVGRRPEAQHREASPPPRLRQRISRQYRQTRAPTRSETETG
jgi:hypothetical protein